MARPRKRYKLKREWKARWTALLRSTIEQGRGYLHVVDLVDLSNTYDALGLLYRAVGLEGRVIHTRTVGHMRRPVMYDYTLSLLNDKILKEVSEDEDRRLTPAAHLNTPVIIDGMRYTNIVEMNDMGVPFDRLADIIHDQF